MVGSGKRDQDPLQGSVEAEGMGSLSLAMPPNMAWSVAGLDLKTVGFLGRIPFK